MLTSRRLLLIVVVAAVVVSCVTRHGGHVRGLAALGHGRHLIAVDVLRLHSFSKLGFLEYVF